MIQPQMVLNKLLAIVYADLFDFPLTQKEARLRQIRLGSGSSSGSRKLPKTVSVKGYEVLGGRVGLVEKRRLRKKYSEAKEGKASEVVQVLKNIPSIQGVFLTGSVAVGNAKKDADIDLMIVTTVNMVWMTRLLVVWILKLKGLYREVGKVGDRFCTNLYLDERHLEIAEKNLFTAHEVLQAKCLFDRGGVEEAWLKENKWVRKYLPLAYNRVRITYNGRGKGVRNTLSGLRYAILLCEAAAFLVQYLYMKPKMTVEKIGWGYAFFHPADLSKKVVARFESRLVALGII